MKPRSNPSWAALLLGIVLLPACLAVSRADEAQPSLMAYLYAPARSVTDRFGVPKSTEILSDGSKILTYRWTSSESEGGYTVSDADPLYNTGLAGGRPYSGNPLGLARRYVPMQMVQLSCEAEFTVGKDGSVREINWQGRGCFSD